MMISTKSFSMMMAQTAGLRYHHETLFVDPSDLGPESLEVTQLLSRMSEGNEEARNRVWALLHDQLHQRAGHEARGAKGQLQATELIGIAFARVNNLTGKDWSSRRHFVAVAALAMRSAVIDHLRHAGSRAGRELLDDVVDDLAARVDGDVVGFYDELEKFSKTDPLMAHALELKALGYESSEISEHLGLPERTFYRHFERARAHLRKRMAWRHTSGNE